MWSHIIPYEPYHPHLGYTTIVTCFAWLCIVGYSATFLRHHPNTRFQLIVFTLFLPLLAEGGSYLFYLIRPAPDQPLGFLLTHIHAFVINRIPIDTYLSQATLAVSGGLIVLLMVRTVVRIRVGFARVRQITSHAVPLDATRHAALVQTFSQMAARSVPSVHVFWSEAPLAFVSGVWHPRIYISSTLLELLSEDELLAVLCHEYAHVVRRDYLLHWLLQPIRELLELLPVSTRLWDRLIASQEEACDQIASTLTEQPLALAKALLKVATAWNQYEVAVPLQAAIQPFATHAGSHTARISQMVYTSDTPEQTSAPRGTYVVGAGLLLLAMLPALLGS